MRGDAGQEQRRRVGGGTPHHAQVVLLLLHVRDIEALGEELRDAEKLPVLRRDRRGAGGEAGLLSVEGVRGALRLLGGQRGSGERGGQAGADIRRGSHVADGAGGDEATDRLKLHRGLDLGPGTDAHTMSQTDPVRLRLTHAGLTTGLREWTRREVRRSETRDIVSGRAWEELRRSASGPRHR